MVILLKNKTIFEDLIEKFKVFIKLDIKRNYI